MTYKSRLARHESRVWTRQAVLFLLLVLGLIWAIIQWGVPVLARLAIFLGDLKSSTQQVEINDTVPPVPPQLASLPTATPSATVAVKGFAEAGTTVKIWLNGQETAVVVANNQGEFVVNKLGLIQGENKIWAVAQDAAGNTSQNSAVMRVMVDDQVPQLTLMAPTEGTMTADTSIEVRGKVSEVEIEVRVNGRFVSVNNSGEFSTRVTLNSGDNLITVTVVDRAGNKTETSLTVRRE